MYKEKVGWGFKLNPNLEEAYNYAKQEYKIENLPGAMFWYTDIDGNTNLWKGLLTIPYQVNYKLNEEIDSAAIKLISKKDSSFLVEHKLPNMAKCKLLHEVYSTLESKDDLLTYDEYGRPLNHNDFYIAAGTCKFVGADIGETKDMSKLGRYEHHYDLAEPIYVTRYVMCENRTFTNMTSITVTDAATGQAQTYTQEPTNLLYVLDNLLKTTGVKTSKEDTTWHSKIKIMDKDLLKNSGVGCSINFNTASLYDNLFKIGKYLKRYPVLYFNKDFDPSLGDNLWDDENEDSREFLLFFEKYDGSDMPEITSEEFYDKSTGYMESQRAFKDAGTIISDLQNTSNSDAIWYPGNNKWLNFTGDDYKLTIDRDSNRCLKLPNKIDKIIELKAYACLKGSLGSDDYMCFVKCSIPCIERQEFVLLSEQEQRKYMWYEKGKNIIDGFYFNSRNNQVTINGRINTLKYTTIDCLYFNVKYKPYYVGRVSIGENNYLQSSVSQLDTVVDSKLFGSYLENYAEENSAIDITNGKIFYKYSDIWMPGTRIVNEDEEYIISTTTIQRYNGFYLASFDANQRIVKRSELVTTDDRQDNKIIDSLKSQLRLSNIRENIIGLELSNNCDNCRCKYIEGIVSSIFNGLSDNVVIASNAYAKFTYDDNSEKFYLVPIYRTVFGNSIVFSINMESNTFLQNTSTYNYQQAEGNTIYNKYTDSFGKVKNISIKLKYESSNNQELSLTDSMQEFYQSGYVGDNIEYIRAFSYISNFKEKNKEYPLISEETFTNVDNVAMQINNFEYLKDTNEVMNINTQICFKAKNTDTFINESLMQYILSVDLNNKQFYLLSIDTNYKVGKGDTISPSKCYHPRCSFAVSQTSLDVLVDTTDSEKLFIKNGWQLAIGVLNDDGNFDILICTKMKRFVNGDDLVEYTGPLFISTVSEG